MVSLKSIILELHSEYCPHRTLSLEKGPDFYPDLIDENGFTLPGFDGELFAYLRRLSVINDNQISDVWKLIDMDPSEWDTSPEWLKPILFKIWANKYIPIAFNLESKCLTTR